MSETKMMMMTTLIESSEALFNDALETMKKKNADYSGSSESMRNFRLSAEIAKVSMSQGILTRLMDKVTRIGNLLDKEDGEVKDESVFDTIQDLINYAAILYYGVKIEQGERNKQVVDDLNRAYFTKTLTVPDIGKELRIGDNPTDKYGSSNTL